MLQIIRTARICETFNLSLVYLETAKGYEVQYSDDDKILETDGVYDTKRDGLKAYNQFKRGLIKEDGYYLDHKGRRRQKSRNMHGSFNSPYCMICGRHTDDKRSVFNEGDDGEIYICSHKCSMQYHGHTHKKGGKK